jgi:hypothetical protein
VAESFCPKGTIAQVLNQFIQIYLNNGFVNLDGFGQVTPAQITAINEQLVTIQNEIDALNKVTQRGNAGLITGDQTVAVAFSTNMPNAVYDIYITPLDTGGVATTPFAWALIDGSKSASGFSIRWTDVPASVDSFDWKAEEQ